MLYEVITDSFGEYMRHVEILTGTGVIADASRLWWDVRPSVKARPWRPSYNFV